MTKTVLSMRLDPTYIEVIDKLPGKDRKEKIMKVLNFAVVKGYGSKELAPPMQSPAQLDDPRFAVLEQQVKTLQSAFANLNHDYMALKNLLGY